MSQNETSDNKAKHQSNSKSQSTLDNKYSQECQDKTSNGKDHRPNLSENSSNEDKNKWIIQRSEYQSKSILHSHFIGGHHIS